MRLARVLAKALGIIEQAESHSSSFFSDGTEVGAYPAFIV